MLLFKSLTLFFLFFAFATMAAAQPNADLHFEKVNNLSQNTVYAIIKDKQGLMWVATADGLNHYDGVEMKIYKPPLQKKWGHYGVEQYVQLY